MNPSNDNFHKLQKLEFALPAIQVHALAQNVCIHGALAVMGSGTK